MVCTLVFLWVSYRVLGPELRGLFVIAVAWTRLGAGIGHLSLGQAILHDATRDKTNDWARASFLAAVRCCVYASCAVWAAFALVYWGAPSLFDMWPAQAALPAFMCVLATVPFLIWEQYGRSILVGLNHVGDVNRALWVSQTAMLALMGLMWPFGLWGAVFAFFMGQFLNAILTLRAISRRTGVAIWPLGPAFVKTLPGMGSLLKGAATLHPGVMAGICMANIDILVVGHYAGSADAAHYQLASQLVAAMVLLPQMAGQAMFSAISEKGALRDAWAECRAAVRGVLAIMVMGMIAAWWLAPSLVPLVFGPKSDISVIYFKYLLLSLPGQAVTALVAPVWVVKGQFRTVAAWGVLTASMHAALNLIWVPQMGVMGAVWSGVAAWTVALVVNAAFFLKTDRENGAGCRI